MTDSSNSRNQVEVHPSHLPDPVDQEQLRRALRDSPRRIPSRYFYDRRGSELFERITRLPEYYLTGAERWLLEASAADIARITSAHELVELGSGSAIKTRILLQALRQAELLQTYVPVDVSQSFVHDVAVTLTQDFPGLKVEGLVADFMQHLPHLPLGADRLVIFLGSTIGNLRRDEATRFLVRLAAAMSEGDHFLLGVDLVKEVSRIEAAYNDSAGVTAAFNLNILRVVNRRFGADFDPEAFTHHAIYNHQHQWIEMRLRSSKAQRVRLDALDLEIDLTEGEEILTEISSKYRQEDVEDLLGSSGFEPVKWYTHPEGLFALALARRGPD